MACLRPSGGQIWKMREAWVAGHRLRKHLAGDQSDSGGSEVLNSVWSEPEEM